MKSKRHSATGAGNPKRLSRSELMARIKSTGNKTTELRLLRLLVANGITGWRRRYQLFGRPDFVFPEKRVVVFVDGCFWHGHPNLCRLPASNKIYWVNKIPGNKRRDCEVTAFLKRSGWTVLRIWEHELNQLNQARLLRRLLRCLARGSRQVKQQRSFSRKVDYSSKPARRRLGKSWAKGSVTGSSGSRFSMKAN